MRCLVAPRITEEMVNSSQPELWSLGAQAFPGLKNSTTSQTGSKDGSLSQDPTQLVTETMGGSKPLSQPLTRAQLPHFFPSPLSTGGANSWLEGRRQKKLCLGNEQGLADS